MCSIYGIIGSNYKNIEPSFSSALHHRGPDDRGMYYHDDFNLALGHTRLSIIDLSSHAQQPMSTEDSNYVLIYNGEIYNYKEIRIELIRLGHSFSTNSDTEVVLRSYIEYGKDCVKYFRGMFAFCVYDKPKGQLFLARDRFGIKPLIYSHSNNHFLFSSELKTFLNTNIISKNLSYRALSEYFQFGSVKQPHTMLEGVYHLMPSHWMTVQVDLSYEIKMYYDYVAESIKLPKIHSYKEATEKVREELEIATKYHMVADVEVGAFLSGGVDSTAVVAMMKHYSDKQINTFSVGFKNQNNIEDETEIASRTAKSLGCIHQNIKIDDFYVESIIDHFIEMIDQPSIDGINTFIVSRETAKNMKVAISGLGGDEIFAGYSHFRTISEYCSQKKGVISFVGQKLNSLRRNRYTNKYEFVGASEEVALELHRTIHHDLHKILKNSAPVETKILPSVMTSVQKISVSEINNYLLNTLLRDNDILSMAHSLEVRPVLLDHNLVELAFSLEDNFKIRNGLLKSVFIDSVKDVIPEEVWQRKKTGFEMPLNNWLNGIFNSRFLDALKHNNAKLLFHEIYLKNLIRRVTALKSKRQDWLVFILLCWLKTQHIELN